MGWLVGVFRSHRRFGLAALGAALAIGLSACSTNEWGFPYRVGVQQGNWVTASQVELLNPGMTREQVRFALGSPLLTSVLHADRWDYPYFYRAPNGDIEERNFTVFFRDGLLARWEGDEQPTLQPFQIAEDLVERSKREREQLELDQAREQAEPGEIQLIPGVDFSTITDVPPSTDPGAPPDEPDAVPQELM